MQEHVKTDQINLLDKIGKILQSIPESFTNDVWRRDKLSTDTRIFLNKAISNEIEYFNSEVSSLRTALMRLKRSLQGQYFHSITLLTAQIINFRVLCCVLAGYFQLTEDTEALQQDIKNNRMLIQCQLWKFALPQYSLDVECFKKALDMKRSFLQVLLN